LTKSGNGLLFKLKQVGIDGTLLEWFSSYLSDHCQRVVVSGQTSSTKYLHAGVPQVSILGPLLFLILVRDMTTNTKSKSDKFADDVLFIKKIAETPTESVQILNNDLANTLDWSVQWLTTLSAPKSTFMRISHKINKLPLNPIIMNNVAILD
jgi:hypothetical protein